MNIEVILNTVNHNVRLTLNPTQCRLKHNYQYFVDELIQKAKEEYKLYLDNNCNNTIRGTIDRTPNGTYRFIVETKYKKYYTWKNLEYYKYPVYKGKQNVNSRQE
jgi:hypothetical protein